MPQHTSESAEATKTSPARGYREVKQVVLERIRSRVWEPEQFLPSEETLAQEFSTTRTTVNRALRELAEEGYLERKRKAGTKVLKSPQRKAKLPVPSVREEIEATGASYRYFLISSELVPAPDWLAARLHLGVAEKVLYLRCLHYAGSKPFQFEDRWIVVDTVPAVLEAELSTIAPGEWLIGTVPYTDVEMSFSAVNANQNIAELLNTQPGDALMMAERATWLEGRPVTYAKMVFLPNYRVEAKY